MGSVSHQDHAELRADQVRAARALLPPPYRQRAIGYLEAGRRDMVFNEEQLLVAMRLVIEYGQPGPSGQVDQMRLAQLLLGLTDIMVSARRNLALRKARELLRTATGMTAPMWIISAAGRYRGTVPRRAQPGPAARPTTRPG